MLPLLATGMTSALSGMMGSSGLGGGGAMPADTLQTTTGDVSSTAGGGAFGVVGGSSLGLLAVAGALVAVLLFKG